MRDILLFRSKRLFLSQEDTSQSGGGSFAVDLVDTIEEKLVVKTFKRLRLRPSEKKAAHQNKNTQQIGNHKYNKPT